MQAYFRAAKAALALRRYEETTQICQDGLQRQPDFPELAAVLKVSVHFGAGVLFADFPAKSLSFGASLVCIDCNSEVYVCG